MSNSKTQEERLDYLVEEFKADSDEYKDLRTPDNGDEKRRILRSLMNIRMPKKMSPEVLKVQDEYLTERAAEKGEVKLSDIPVIRDGLSIWQGDITRLSELNETPELIGDDYERFCNSGYSKVIRSIRKQCGMLQGEFAKELDVSRSSLANWEQGRFIPSRDNYNILKKYAEERGLSLDES